MLDAIDRLLDTVVGRRDRVRVVDTDHDTWERLDALAAYYQVTIPHLARTILGLASHMDRTQLAVLLVKETADE